MSVLLTVVAAIAAFTLINRFHYQSATALGKVSALLSTTAVFAEAWSKTSDISKRFAANPTQISLPTTARPATPPPVTSMVPARPRSELDDFFDEHPSARLTGGIRGYNAYAPFDK